MPTERPPTQRGLVDLPLQLTDRKLWIEHAFPFVDRHWKVVFFLLDPSGALPCIVRETLEPQPGGLFSHASSASLLPLGAVPLAELAELVHFDPWWVLRKSHLDASAEAVFPDGYRSPDPTWLEAYKATNIAVRFRFGGRRYGVTDLVFESGLGRLASMEARTSLGRIQVFRYGDIDLGLLRRPPPRLGTPLIRSP